MSWTVEKIFDSDIAPPSGINSLKKRRYYKKEEPFICKECDRVWQYTENRVYVEYVTDFPKYGCTREICRQCLKKENK